MSRQSCRALPGNPIGRKRAKGGREQLQYVVIRSILRYLFDYVVSTGEDRGGNGDPKFLSGLQVDGELELRRLFRR
jgi:hypothetical protein